MITILYIEDDPSIAEIYSLMIKESLMDVEIVHLTDGVKALQELKANLSKYSLVISDYNLPTISGGDIFKFVNSQMLGIPFILLSGIDCTTDEKFKNFFDSHVRNAVLLKPVSIEELTNKVQWCLDGESDLLQIYQKNLSNFDEKVAISTDVFLKLNVVPCDVYLCLKDGKYIKVINKKEIFQSHLIKKLILKGVDTFYVNRSELSAYAQSVVHTLYGMMKFKKAKGDDIQKSQLTNKAIDILKSNLLKCGFNPIVISVADEIIDLQLSMIKSNPDLNAFLEKFQNFSKANTDHTRIVCYVVVMILKELGWDSESSLHRMSLAALLHDLTLSDDFFKRVHTDDQIKKMSDEDRKIYLRHPEESAHLAKNFEAVASGIEQIILEHHELPDGKGFPRKLNYNHVHPLSATLHLADYMADLLWENEFEVNIVKQIVKEKRSYYSRGFYRKPYEALLRLIKDM